MRVYKDAGNESDMLGYGARWLQPLSKMVCKHQLQAMVIQHSHATKSGQLQFSVLSDKLEPLLANST
jgi:hypothetical protein